jgi:microcystin-dependent protein
MANPYLGEIRLFAFGYAPQGWMLCNGQTLSIAQYSALYSLLGTTYGGDGVTTFNLPNLQSRVPVHFGQGAGLSSYSMGEATGSETVTLNATQMPSHTHAVNATTGSGSQSSPAGNYLASPGASPHGTTVAPYAPSNSGNATTLSGATIGAAGGSQPHSNLQPVLCVSFCICVSGLFPA